MTDIDWKAKYNGLVRALNAESGGGVYPMGHLSKDERERHTKEASDAYKCGWNDAGLDVIERYGTIIEQAHDGISDDLNLLLTADVGWISDGKFALNMNDTFAWACADCCTVEPADLSEVSRLFQKYGFGGLMYWYTLQPDGPKRSAFHDNQRAIEFVQNEEAIRKETPESNKRAYRRVTYTLGLP